jgi:hypothetical protein
VKVVKIISKPSPQSLPVNLSGNHGTTGFANQSDECGPPDLTFAGIKSMAWSMGKYQVSSGGEITGEVNCDRDSISGTITPWLILSRMVVDCRMPVGAPMAH